MLQLHVCQMPSLGMSVEQPLCSGCGSEVDTPPAILSSLSVVENSERKKRVVLNLGHLNKLLFKQNLI